MATEAARRAAARATGELAAWSAGLRWEEVPEAVADRLRLVLVDTVAVTVAGARSPEQRALVGQWPTADGPAPLVGAGRTGTADEAARLNGTAGVRLELDEGHKHAAGHPMTHAAHAVLAAAAEADVDGPALFAAALAGYEVAARFGRATRLREGMHPHGNWGVAGAAAGAARVLGLSGAATAAAIDTAAGLAVAGPFACALDGNPVRDAWVGAGNANGLAAARMAAAGLARTTGTAADTLGGLLGTSFDADGLAAGTGRRWEVTGNYFKRHACCSFTHPAVDAVLAVVGRHPELAADPVRRVAEVHVETHALAGGLDRTQWPTRLAAMFSIPFAVAAALLRGEVGPEASDPDALRDERLRALAGRVGVRVRPELTARLPAERAARVRVVTDRAEHVEEVPNPVGDADHRPMDAAAVRAKARSLVGAPTARAITDLVARLETAAAVRPVLRGLAEL
ncbi:2-methylcitrate dehydratase PrpD [Spinactinospora alkalitolerans]|uniref:2-methylcitrate dehydratase PrpD n=1 Tax=Spinactinospora alkalitolerans TaxID=687207 RepID=A0A852TRQ4_9ACTN|nr:MmgE/PrpD family protein [Spinactinospora alkalitolerans]NYE45977.1 2-methylcitrate dehydratase PrpD [Spinactinospora alkalitolerans]